MNLNKYQTRNKKGQYENYDIVLKLIRWVVKQCQRKKATCKQKSLMI